ncbi:MAG: DUF4203 domain-containing protein [Chthoniobacterales bacterium]
MQYAALFHFTPILQILVGIALLCAGRKLFWLFVGVIGFLVGLQYAGNVSHGLPQLAILVLAIGIGVAGAILAIFMERIAIALAGALAGGILAMHIAALLGMVTSQASFIAFGVGALLAAILVSALFDWALIILSAMTGGYMVSEVLPMNQNLKWLTAAVLCIAGIFIQSRFQRSAPEE